MIVTSKVTNVRRAKELSFRLKQACRTVIADQENLFIHTLLRHVLIVKLISSEGKGQLLSHQHFLLLLLNR